ncbi:rifampicin phosphotransferase [Bathymodiolus platifrons methanotrophic gill symbiont]|nr:rifampicin phosphotransferase [Bathymodiolus platifrons methanotrophic gill symbiont]
MISCLDLLGDYSESYGRLKVINPGDLSPGEDVIAIYTFIPNTLGHVGGIITEAPQTPLSHINLKARQNDTPNAYMKNVRNNPEVIGLIDQWVHYSVNDNGVHLELATEESALNWLADRIPAHVTIPESDLSVTAPRPLAELTQSDWTRVGVKAANVAELGKILAVGVAPKGYALPFAMYDEFMRSPRCPEDMTVLCANKHSLTFYDYVENLLKDEAFSHDQPVREQALTELRELIEKAETPQSLVDEIEMVRLFWEPAGEPFSQRLRVRSSTNNEDLPGFNGAGLYGSFTHKPKEGKLINSIKQLKFPNY